MVNLDNTEQVKNGTWKINEQSKLIWNVLLKEDTHSECSKNRIYA